MADAVWHGTGAELADLRRVIEAHCECRTEKVPMGGWPYKDLERDVTCSLHELLAHNQRWPDGLLCGRRRSNRLQAEEWNV